MTENEPFIDSDRTQRRVLLFIRAPELGRVKTRLEHKMDAATVLAIYQCFVEDIVKTLTTGRYETSIYFTPVHQALMVKEWLGPRTHIQAQTGQDLGARMRHAFSDVFATDVGRAVLIGSDFPDLDIRIIHEAFAFLQKKDVVMGPAKDGGYYLIGFRKDAFDGEVFSGIDWGSGHVGQQTLQYIQHTGLSSHVLPVWQDIDTFEDLRAFYRRNKDRGHAKLKTMMFLKRLNLKGFR